MKESLAEYRRRRQQEWFRATFGDPLSNLTKSLGPPFGWLDEIQRRFIDLSYPLPTPNQRTRRSRGGRPLVEVSPARVVATYWTLKEAYADRGKTSSPTQNQICEALANDLDDPRPLHTNTLVNILAEAEIKWKQLPRLVALLDEAEIACDEESIAQALPDLVAPLNASEPNTT